jgi:hypothetical protein
MNTALLISTKRSPERASRKAPEIVYRAYHYFYPTPPEAVHALLSVEQFDGPIWEPACGNGAISEVLKSTSHDVHSTDLIDRGYGQGGQDFLCPITFTRVMIEYPRLKHVITNPPYGYKTGIADKFVGQALKFARMQGGKVAMLLNLGSLAHRTRTSKWRNDPPARIHIMDDVTCFPNGNPHQAGRFITEHRYCWVVWEHLRSVGTQLTWLRMAEFRQQGGAA